MVRSFTPCSLRLGSTARFITQKTTTQTAQLAPCLQRQSENLWDRAHFKKAIWVGGANIWLTGLWSQISQSVSQRSDLWRKQGRKWEETVKGRNFWSTLHLTGHVTVQHAEFPSSLMCYSFTGGHFSPLSLAGLDFTAARRWCFLSHAEKASVREISYEHGWNTSFKSSTLLALLLSSALFQTAWCRGKWTGVCITVGPRLSLSLHADCVPHPLVFPPPTQTACLSVCVMKPNEISSWKSTAVVILYFFLSLSLSASAALPLHPLSSPDKRWQWSICRDESASKWQKSHFSTPPPHLLTLPFPLSLAQEKQVFNLRNMSGRKWRLNLWLPETEGRGGSEGGVDRSQNLQITQKLFRCEVIITPLPYRRR